MKESKNEEYLEEKREQFEKILENKNWDRVQEIYKEMEDDGMGGYVLEISSLMSNEDITEYSQWDEKINGSIETQTDDNS